MENEFTNKKRVTQMTLSIDSFGTDKQRRDDIKRLEKELKLQGFKFRLTVINYT
jgi:hypothetical protein